MGVIIYIFHHHHQPPYYHFGFSLVFTRVHLNFTIFLLPTISPFSPTANRYPNKSTELPCPKLTFLAAALLKVDEPKNFCRLLCAKTALSRLSSWKRYNTAAREKSRAESVMLKSAVSANIAVEESTRMLEEEEDEGEGGETLEVSKMIPDAAVPTAAVAEEVVEEDS